MPHSPALLPGIHPFGIMTKQPVVYRIILPMRICLLFVTVALLLGASLVARAAGGSWSVDTNGNWSGTTNWTDGTVAAGAGNTATFNINITANRTTTLDSARIIGGLIFGNSGSHIGAAQSWTIGGSSTLTLDNSGSSPTITCWPLRSAGNSACNVSVPLDGTHGFTEQGSGTLWLNGNNSALSGTLAISAGRVFNNHINGLGSMNVSIADGSYLSFWSGGAFAGTFTLNGIGRTIDGQTKNTLYADNGSGAQVILNGSVTFNATADLGGSTAAASFTLNGPVGGLGGVIKQTVCVLTLNGANTYAGGTTLNAGQLNINNGGASAANSAIGTGPLTIAGGTIDNTSAADITVLSHNPQNWTGDFSYLGSLHKLNLGTGAVTLGGYRQVTVNGSALTIGGPIGDGGSGYGLTKAGAGTLTLNGVNNYSGRTTISGGTLALGSSGTLSNTLSVAISAGATFDVSASSFYSLGSGGRLTASGTGSAVGTSAAAIKGAAGGIVSLGSCPVVLAYDGAHPALYLSQGNLVLNSNAFVVNSPAALAAGIYTIIQQASGSVATSGSLSVTVSALAPGMNGSISITGGNVNLVVEKGLTNLATNFNGTNATLSFYAAGSSDYFWNSTIYVVQRTTNLSSATGWTAISTNAPATNQWVQVTDRFTDLGCIPPTQAYYRVLGTRNAQQLILAAPPAPSPEQPFSFALPGGPQFTAAQTNAQYAAGQQVLPLVQAAYQAGASSIRIPPGDYRFPKETWGPVGPIYPLQFANLQRDSQHPLTIDASDATFWFDLPDDQAPTEHFCVGFVNCSNVVFRGATIDRSTRGNVEGRITQFDYANNRMEIVLSPGCPLPTHFSNGLEQRLLPFKADGTFCAPLYALQTGGTKLKYISITPSANPGCAWVNMATPDLLQTITNSYWINAYGPQGVLTVGDGLSCIYTVAAAVELKNSANVTLYGVNIYAAKALGAEWYGPGAHLWKDCYFGPRPGTSQWQGGEGFLFSGTGHGPTLDHVTILHTTDDMANFHGYWSEVVAVAGNLVTFTNHDGNANLMPPDAAVGDTVMFYNRNNGTPLGQGRVTTLASASVTLNVTASGFANAIARWPQHECANWLIQNCYWHDNYQRIMMQSGPGQIQNCTFARNGSCLEFNFDFSYIEGGIPNNIVVANNTFTDVAPIPGMGTLDYHQHTYGTLTARLISNLTITGNTITRPGEAAIDLLGVGGLTIARNNLVDPIRATALARPGQSHLRQAIYLSNCANGLVQTNNVSDLGHFTVPSPLTGSSILGTDAQCQNITNLDGTLLQ